MLSNANDPSDERTSFNLGRTTTGGTATSVTPEPLDSQQIASQMTVGQNHTVEPSYAGKTLLQFSQNARAIFQWFAHPKGNIWTTPAANNGIAFKAISASAASLDWDVVMHWEE